MIFYQNPLLICLSSPGMKAVPSTGPDTVDTQYITVKWMNAWMSEFSNPLWGPSVQDKEHRHNFCLENDSDKAASNISLYLMMGCVP